MSDSKVNEEVRRLQLGRRVKRGIVASYIHELSERHRADAGAQSRELALATARKT